MGQPSESISHAHVDPPATAGGTDIDPSLAPDLETKLVLSMVKRLSRSHIELRMHLPRGRYKKAIPLSPYVFKAGLSKQLANPPGRLKRFVVVLPERQVKLLAH